jgi:hypothetical protein
MEEEFKTQENSVENTPSQVEVDTNSISESGPVIGSDVQTYPEKVYRSVNSFGAIEDIYDSGVVRSSTTAKEEKGIEGYANSKGKKTVYWTRGVEGKSHILPKEAYLIEAPYDVAKERIVRKEDITAIYFKLENNSVSNLLENPEKLESDVVQYRLDKIAAQLEKKNVLIATTTNEVNAVRHDLGLSGIEEDIPSIAGEKKDVAILENTKAILEKRLQELLQEDVSENYASIIAEVKQSKIDWAHSEELSRRLKLKGANDEDVATVRQWLIDNITGTKTFVLPRKEYKEVIEVLREMTGEEEISEGRAMHINGENHLVPDYIKSTVFVQEKTPPPVLSSDKGNEIQKTIDTDDLHHEFGHAAQDGLLQSDLYKNWNPSFKDTAPDKEYVGNIIETDTRIRSMFRDLGGLFDPQKEPFTQKHLDQLKIAITSKDTKDLFAHYDDETIIKLANELPAI